MPKQTNFRDYIEKSTEDKNRKNPVQSVVVNTYDEILYKRVCEIIDKGLDKVNPINELIDKKIFYGLDFEAKQHYISTLNFKYKELKQRYYRERMASYSFG